MKKHIIALVVGLLIIVGLGFYVVSKTEQPAPTRFGGTTNVGSLYANEGGIRQGGLNATSTSATTYTLVAADLTNVQTLVLTPTVNTLTLTLPSAADLATFVPNVGDEYNFSIFNGTTTAAKNITLVKTISAGVNVLNASTTLNILPQTIMWVDVIRSTNSTTTVLLIPAV